MTAKYYIDKNGEYLGGFADGALPPKGAIEVPMRPASNMVFVDGVWENDIEQLRTTTSLPKDDFILAALDAGVLSEPDAEEATNGWPTGWDDFFTGQPARDRIEAKARWASATTIARNAPLIEALAAFKGLTPEQVDALFGI
jgi:hypothetical protein